MKAQPQGCQRLRPVLQKLPEQRQQFHSRRTRPDQLAPALYARLVRTGWHQRPHRRRRQEPQRFMLGGNGTDVLIGGKELTCWWATVAQTPDGRQSNDYLLVARGRNYLIRHRATASTPFWIPTVKAQSMRRRHNSPAVRNTAMPASTAAPTPTAHLHRRRRRQYGDRQQHAGDELAAGNLGISMTGANETVPTPTIVGDPTTNHSTG